MEWYSSMQTPGLELEKMLLEYQDEKNQSEAQANFWANYQKNWPN